MLATGDLSIILIKLSHSSDEGTVSLAPNMMLTGSKSRESERDR